MSKLRSGCVISILLCAVGTIPAYAAKPQIQWDSNYAFGSVETFAWQPTPGSSLAERDPFLHSRIITAIEYELTGSGLTEVQSDPDIYVTYHTSTEEKVSLRSNSYGYGFGGYGRVGWGYYGYGMAGPVYTETEVIEYDEGTLVVDIWDAASMQLIWRGTVTRVYSDNVNKAERQIVKSIQSMAKQGRKLWQRELRERARAGG